MISLCRIALFLNRDSFWTTEIIDVLASRKLKLKRKISYLLLSLLGVCCIFCFGRNNNTKDHSSTPKWNFYRPRVPLHDLIPVSRPKLEKPASIPDSTARMIILEGSYTPEDFPELPDLYVVAVEVDEVLRLMPKNAYRQEGDILVPRDLEFHARLWESSRMIGCLNLTILRNIIEPPKLMPDDLHWLSVLRDLHFEYRSIPFLIGGTLLGWRRECSVIPHTTDMDIASFEDEFPMALIEDAMNMTATAFRLLQIIGRPGDSYEATFGGHTERGAPWFEAEFCTAVMHGYMFHVPCDPDPILEADYGPDWRVDRPTDEYSYGKNVVENGNFAAEG
ncbi:unnamed protein product, partial [Mesorhabditis spiculigera]